MIKLFEDVAASHEAFKNAFGMTNKFILGNDCMQKMSNEDVVNFLQWIIQGEIEVKRNYAKKSTEDSSYSINVERGPFWKHLGHIKVPAKRKSRARVDWMTRAFSYLIEDGMKKSRETLKEKGFAFAEPNSLLKYCLENNLLTQENMK